MKLLLGSWTDYLIFFLIINLYTQLVEKILYVFYFQGFLNSGFCTNFSIPINCTKFSCSVWGRFCQTGHSIPRYWCISGKTLCFKNRKFDRFCYCFSAMPITKPQYRTRKDDQSILTYLRDPSWRPLTVSRYLPVLVLSSDEKKHYFLDADYESMSHKGSILLCVPASGCMYVVAFDCCHTGVVLLCQSRPEVAIDI